MTDQTTERDWRREWIEYEARLHDLLAEALGYPTYEPGEPGYSPDMPQYVTGDHTGETLAMEAAAILRALPLGVRREQPREHDPAGFGDFDDPPPPAGPF